MKNLHVRAMVMIVVVVAVVGVCGCKPDLRVTLAANSAYAEGDDVAGTVSLNVSNTGSARAAGTNSAGANGYMVDLVLSSDGVVPITFANLPSPYTFTEDMLLKGGRVSNTVDLAGGANTTSTAVAGVIPPGTPSPAYLCAVVDPGMKIDESDESNNSACVKITIEPAGPRCVTFESPTVGTGYGQAAGHSPGDQVLVEDGIPVSVADFRWPNGGTFMNAEVVASIASFGVDDQFLQMNNINIDLDFSGLGFEVSKVTFHYRDLGGFENFAVNGDPSPCHAGELAAVPSPIGGTTLSTVPPVPGGPEYVATLEGPVERIVVGGQEFAIDQICAWP